MSLVETCCVVYECGLGKCMYASTLFTSSLIELEVGIVRCESSIYLSELWLKHRQNQEKRKREFSSYKSNRENGITKILGTVLTSSEKFENAALLPPSTLIRHENGAFRKRSSTEPKEFENAGFLIWRGRKTLRKRSFSKAIYSRKSFDFPDRISLNYKSKIQNDR